MADAFLVHNEPPQGDRRLATDRRTVGGQVVDVATSVLVDGSANNKLAIGSDGAARVDAKSRGTTLTSNTKNVTTSASELVAASTARRTLRVWNQSHTVTVYVGDANVSAVRGTPVFPRTVVEFTAAAGAQFHIVGDAAVTVGWLAEAD